LFAARTVAVCPKTTKTPSSKSTFTPEKPKHLEKTGLGLMFAIITCLLAQGPSKVTPSHALAPPFSLLIMVLVIIHLARRNYRCQTRTQPTYV
jgi:hypothetical protein